MVAMFTRILSGFLLAAALGFPQQGSVAAGGNKNPAGPGSFKDGGLEFKQQGSFVYVSEELSGKKVSGAPIILTPNGPMYAAFLQGMPGEEPSPYKQKAVEIYNAHLKGVAPASQPVEVASTRNDSSVGQPQSQHAEVGQPIALPNGSTVTFQTAAKETTIVVHNQKALPYPDVTFRVRSAGILSAAGNAGFGAVTSTSRGAAQAITGQKVEVDTGGGFADLSSMRAGKMIFQSQVDDATAAEKMLLDASKVNGAMQAIRLVMSVQN
jgi:hypothetical protein